jgi:hypothetical protein
VKVSAGLLDRQFSSRLACRPGRTRCRRHFRPVDQLVADADQRFRDVEGRALEKLVGVALNAAERIIRLGSCKRSTAELVRDLPVFGGHVERFLDQFPEYAGWRVERLSLAPHVPQDVRQEIERQG